MIHIKMQDVKRDILIQTLAHVEFDGIRRAPQLNSVIFTIVYHLASTLLFSTVCKCLTSEQTSCWSFRRGMFNTQGFCCFMIHQMLARCQDSSVKPCCCDGCSMLFSTVMLKNAGASLILYHHMCRLLTVCWMDSFLIPCRLEPCLFSCCATWGPKHAHPLLTFYLVSKLWMVGSSESL